MTGDPFTGDPKILRFGAFEFDLRSNEMRKQGMRIRVQGQPLKVLRLLLEQPGEVVTREQLRQRLWPDKTYVDFEHGLNSALTRLRQALSDCADTPRFVETLPRQGYRFIAPVVVQQAASAGAPELPADRFVELRSYAAIARTIPLRLVLGALVIGIFGSLAAWHPWIRQEPLPMLEQLSHDLGLATDPAISPDGKLLTYASDRNSGHLNIWLRQLEVGGEGVQLTHFDTDAHQPTFSPDGSKIVFCRDGDQGGIYVTAAIGGEPLRITDSGRDPRFSPDGNWIAFWRAADMTRTSGDSNGAIYVIPASGGSPKRLGPVVSSAPIWAHDSKHLLVARTMADLAADWLVIPLDGSRVVSAGAFPVLKRQGFSMEMGMPLPTPAAWSGDDVYFSGKRGDTVNIWRVRLPQQDVHARSSAEQLTFGIGTDVSPSPTGGQLVFASLAEHTAIWSLPMDPNRMRVTGDMQRITDTTDSEVTPGMTADGRYIAYTSDRGKRQDVYIRDLETGKERPLATTADPEWHPVFSPDGSRVAYTNRGKDKGIYIVPATGGVPERVGDGSGFIWAWSQDNERLLFRKDHTGGDISLLDLSSKAESLFLHRDGMNLYQAKFSPGDRWVAFEAVRSQGDSVLYVVPLKDGLPGATDTWIPITAEADWADKPRWSPDGSTLYFISQHDGFRCVWAQPLNAETKHPSGPAVAVRHFHSASLSLANVPLGFLEIDVASNRLVLTLEELRGNIWRSRIAEQGSN